MQQICFFMSCTSREDFALVVFFFFFKQKTAYEMLRSLVGSEMCIRDRYQRRVRGSLAAHVPQRAVLVVRVFGTLPGEVLADVKEALVASSRTTTRECAMEQCVLWKFPGEVLADVEEVLVARLEDDHGSCARK
eukprot:TRINITY_DN3154_c0_g1_i2.p2 TRINITY_DN3154_c0_g1~~TRINITY_DN3154_c0_g1_i2.p2  ORF type:complete len:134 (-),score=39.95 TRINITY_DN3154_c0_g1_i2:335-736(-)